MLVMKIIAIPARCAASLCDVAGGNDATIAVKTEYVTTKLPAPNMRGFFLPTVSRIVVMNLVGKSLVSGEVEVHIHSVHEVRNRTDCTINPLH